MTQVMTNTSYLQRLLPTGSDSSTSGPLWLQARREEARRQWLRVGLPKNSDEQWRFTDLSPLAETDFSTPAAAPAAVPSSDGRLPGLEGAALVLVNGNLYRPASRLPPAPVKIALLSQAAAADSKIFADLLGAQAHPSHHGLIALNTANFSDVVLVEVPAGVTVAAPLNLAVHALGNQPFTTYPRILLKVGANAAVTVVFSFTGPDHLAYLTNSVVEATVGAGSRVELVKIQREGTAALHIGSDYIHLDRDVTFQSLSLNQGGLLVRNNVTVTLAGPGSQATLNGLSMTAGRQHVDNHTMLDHAREQCASHELYKSLLAGRSSGTFTGKILVRPGAQKTDAKQTSKAVLLSSQATMNSQPQLEIYADDVKCTHGSTNGPLDDEQLFYLRARGLACNQARAMLTSAFASDVLARVWQPALRTMLEDLVVTELHRLEREEF